MLLFRRFHYENLAGHLRWMVDETAAIDPGHEVRSHGGWSPRPWDEICAPQVDSWGMSMPSSNLMNPPDAGKAADRAFAFEWSRALGRGRALVERGDIRRHEPRRRHLEEAVRPARA